MENILKQIRKNESTRVMENVPLSRLTTYRVGGNAKVVVYPRNTKSLISIIKLLKSEKKKYMILGKGSNVLFSDKEYDGVIIILDHLDKVTLKGNTIKVGAGYSLMKLAQFAIKKGLAGLEFAPGIPGTLGGAVYMNAGAYKSDMGYIVSRVKVLTPEYKVIDMVNRECKFKYRSSFFQKHKNYIILEVELRLKKGNKEELLKITKDRRERRIASQPLEYPSAGSVFRNPREDLPAGKLIDELGLKGLRKGGAQISSKHANFIINRKNAKAEDVKGLIDFVKDMVKDNYDIDLHVEQELVNWE